MPTIRAVPEQAYRLLKKWEGLRLNAYYDTAGIPTIGFGKVISWAKADRQQVTRRRRPPVDKFPPITREQAEADLKLIVPRYALEVVGLFPIPLTDGMYAALISFNYNCGASALRHSTLRRMILRGDVIDAAEQFLRWKFDASGGEPPGLIARRRDEREVYLSDAHMFEAAA